MNRRELLELALALPVVLPAPIREWHTTWIELGDFVYPVEGIKRIWDHGVLVYDEFAEGPGPWPESWKRIGA